MRNFAEKKMVMKNENLVPTIKERDWDIPQILLKKANRTRLVEMLSAINKITSGASYYIRDSYTRSLIIDSPTSAILCGHTVEKAEKEGFAFYENLFDKKEWPWLKKMFSEGYKVFYNHPPSKRKHLVSCYNFSTRHIGKGDLVLSHKGIPFQLCNNGNLWLSLCAVSISKQKQLNKATITNTETGEQYEYINGRFILSDKLVVTSGDLLILELMGKDLSSEQIAKQLGVSMSSFVRKKQSLFDKLGVKNPAGAMRKAHLKGII